MQAQKTTAVSPLRRAMETVCEHLPNCTKALHLLETGCTRPLSGTERLRLRYHSRLCPFCGCAAGKFASAFQKYRESPHGPRNA